MKFSIIIPVYNVESYLPVCIDSILRQTFSDYEIILVDDGSTDKSPELCDQYAAEYQNIQACHQKNQGQAAARNYGISFASGEYILFVDSDDYFIGTDTLSKIAECGGVDIINFNWKEVPDGQAEGIYPLCGKYEGMPNHYKSGEEFLKDALNNNHLFPWYLWFNAYSLEFWKKNKFQFISGIKYEDVELAYQLYLAAQSINICASAVYGYRTDRKGSTVTQIRVKTYVDSIHVIERNIKGVESRGLPSDLERALCNNFSCLYYSQLIQSSRIENKSDQKAFWNVLKENKWICNYTTESRQSMVRNCIKVLGIPNTARLLGLRRKFQGKEAK